MKSRLLHEHYEDSSDGFYASRVLDGRKIEDMIIEATRDWARKIHRDLDLPLRIENGSLPAEFRPHEYRDKQYLPWDINSHMDMAKAAVESEKKLTNLADTVKIGYHFMREIHKTMKEEIFMEFIPHYKRDKSEHDDPNEKSVIKCLEYARDKARDYQMGIGEIKKGDRKIIDSIIEGLPWAKWYFRWDLLPRVLDGLYRKQK